jgi:RNA ligase (TIGR02306 family)
MRKLVTRRIVNEILPIPNSDNLEHAVTGGWKVVVKKNEFKAGDPCWYIEIDAFLPDGNPAWQFLVDKQPMTMNDRKGHRLRTVKLRGAISQGLVLSVDALNSEGHELEDYAEFFGVVLYEPPIPTQLAGQIAGPWPSNVPHTDQERSANLVDQIFSPAGLERPYLVTIKLDGTSMTVFSFINESGEFDVGVCSRRMNLKVSEDSNNTLVKLYLNSGIREYLESEYKQVSHLLAIQGELMGPGIQGNRENLKEHHLFVYDIWNITEQRYENDNIMTEVLNLYTGLKTNLVHKVPKHPCHTYVDDYKTLPELGITNHDELMKFAAGPSLNNQTREGLVFKSYYGNRFMHHERFTFKCISEDFLLNEKD